MIVRDKISYVCSGVENCFYMFLHVLYMLNEISGG